MFVINGCGRQETFVEKGLLNKQLKNMTEIEQKVTKAIEVS